MTPQITFLFVLALALCPMLLARADVRFTAHLVMANMTGVSGLLSGTIYYYYDQAVNATDHWMRIDWDAPVGTKEVYDYAHTLRFKECSSCTSETYTNPVNQLFLLSTDLLVTPTQTLSGTNCKRYSRPADAAGIVDVWYDTGASILCKVVKNDNTAMVFTSVVPNSAPQTKFTESASWNCPTPTCSRTMDIVLVVDDSGSIETEDWSECVDWNWLGWCTKRAYYKAEWPQFIDFCKSIANSYDIANRKSTIGAAFFSDYVRVISWLTGSKQNFLTDLGNAQPTSQDTCLGCGLWEAGQILAKPVAGREDLSPSKVVIVMTDGQPNVDSYKHVTYDYVAEAKKLRDSGALVIGVGIGSDVDMDLIRSFCTQVPGVDTAIFATSFSTLSTTLNKLISKTCTALPIQNCNGCNGYCSCGQNCTCPTCPPNDACTSYTCDPDTKGCVPHYTNCDDHNACTKELYCDPAVGCIRSNVTCNDGDPCTDDKCSPSSGCYTDKHVCIPSDKCHTSTCSTVSGCSNDPITCNDLDSCTIDQCNPLKGCYSVPVNCTDADLCTVDKCENGICPHQKVDCADKDGCTDDSCDSAFGCQHTPVSCDDKDACTVDKCYSVVVGSTITHTCNHTTIPNCKDYCGTVDCNNATHKRTCFVGTCRTDSTGLAAECIYTNKTAPGGLCNMGNKCILDYCDGNDVCTHVNVQCAPQACQDVECNSTTGACQYTPRQCPTDPCSVAKCNSETNSCESSPLCPHQPCFIESCIVDANNVGHCDYVPRPCISGSLCMTASCENTTDACVFQDISCDDSNACTTHSCDPKKGCVYTNISCDDGKLCTIDTCDPHTGCNHALKCVDSKWCTDDYCNPTTGSCSFSPVDCGGVVTASDASCFIGVCSEKKRSCYKKYSDQAALDVCGGCIDVNAPNSTFYSNTSTVTTQCLSSWSSTTLAVALTGAAVAGIIIAAIIAALVVLAAGSFGTYELVTRASQARPSATVSNPLYESSEKECVNTLYTGN